MTDFDNIVQRRKTGSLKWDIPVMQGVLPMWVADMDFQIAPEISEALHDRINHDIFGYTIASESLEQTIVSRMKDLYDWEIKSEWLVWLPGLETSLALAASSIGVGGDGVMCFPPIYPPFYTGPKAANRKSVQVSLKLSGDDWEIDYETMEKALKEYPNTKLLLFCNPHNPVGKVFSESELTELGKFCCEHDLKICSDEVHCDLILNGKKHVPLASLSDEFSKNTITLMAPSKTFNVAGLGCGFAIISDFKWRQSFQISMRGVSPFVNTMGYVACEAAYKFGEAWRLELIEYLKGNVQIIVEFLKNDLPDLEWVKPEATYLAWFDANKLAVDDPTPFFKRHGVGFSPGHTFGSKGWVRMNFGCSKATLEEGLSRMKKAVDSLSG